MPELDAKKILVIRLSSLGDVVLTTAIFPSLRARWPHARVTVATKAAYAAVFERNTGVHEVLTFDASDDSFGELASRVKREKWDVVVDLHANLRSWFLRLVAGGNWTIVVDKDSLARQILVYFKLKLAGLERSVRERILDTLKEIDVPVVGGETQLFPADPSPVLAAHGAGPDTRLIGVAPGARHATKRWRPERFAEAAARLAGERGARIVLLGDASDAEAAAAVAAALPPSTEPPIDLVGKTDLSQLIAVTSRLSFLLTNDSGLMHIGEALGIPLVAVFGPTVKEFGFAPYRPTSRVAEIALGCRPCTLHGTEVCPLGHHRCMNDLPTDLVLGAAAEIA